MKLIQAYACTELGALADEPLFRTLAGDPPPARTLQMLPHLTFWSGTFQDITALNLARVTDPVLRAVVGTHHDEDAGHDLWFADDLRLIDGSLPDLLAVFDPAYQPAREVCYEMMAEVFRAESDWERVALPIALEEGGKVFLPRMIEHFRRVGLASALSALGTRHAQSEAAHTLHTDDVAGTLSEREVPLVARMRAMAMVDRVTTTSATSRPFSIRAIHDTVPEAETAVAERVEALLAGANIGGQPR